ncbi:Cytochrome P450 [Sarcoptes scabiei]|nr:Cytochrome P450 [Sarcoptes scabiei]
MDQKFQKQFGHLNFGIKGMDSNKEIVNCLNRINTISKDEMRRILSECDRELFPASESFTDNSLDNIADQSNMAIKFAIKSFLLEATKNNIDGVSTKRSLEDEGFDLNNENVQIFTEYIVKSIPKLRHNLENFELSPIFQFSDLEWSQMFEIESSTIESMRKKSYLINFDVKQKDEENDDEEQTRSVTIRFTEKELNDFHSTIKDCIRNLDHYIDD